MKRLVVEYGKIGLIGAGIALLLSQWGNERPTSGPGVRPTMASAAVGLRQ